MKIFKFLLLSLVLVLVIYVLNTHQVFNSSYPAIGTLMSPTEGFWANAVDVDHFTNLNINNPKLKSEVEVVFDDRMVPHIFAQNLEDAFFAQGYVLASQRLWQMDMATRATGGFLSEVLGNKTLAHDQLQCRKGIRHIARKMAQKWKNSKDIEYINAYASGINAYISNLDPKNYPIEYKLMGFEPSPWTIEKSAYFILSMAETLSTDNFDLENSQSRKILGDSLFYQIYKEYNPKQSPVIPKGTSWDYVLQASEEGLSLYNGALPNTKAFPNQPEIIGSNNWAVSGRKTKSGNPILCNDPHLSITLPSIWFEIQISVPEANVYGVCLPALPGVVIGFNDHIAWGVTNLGHDLIDWYAIQWADEKKEHYLLDGVSKAIVVEEETIKVRDSESVVEKVKFTYWGPIVHPSDDDNEKDNEKVDMAMKWIVADIGGADSFSQLSAFVALMKAKNYDDYSNALLHYDFPPQNFVFASNSGDIALKVNGKLPLRKEQQGRFVQDGSDLQNDWNGHIPMKAIPQVKNPKQGYVASANQHSTEPSYPYYYSGGFDDYRGRVINRFLSNMEDITPDDMKAMQNNNYSILPEESLPILLSCVSASSRDNEAYQLLSSWDFSFDAEKKAPVLFERWYEAYYKAVFDEIYQWSDSMDLRYPESWRLIELMEKEQDHTIFDDQNTIEIRETACDIAQKTFNELFSEIDIDAISTWSEKKHTSINHLAGIDAFSVKNINIGGFKRSINAVQGAYGPSWRMVVELDETPKAWGVFPGGQSGNPGSPYYSNMVNQWRDGQYNLLRRVNDIKELDASALYTLKFKK